MDFGYERPYNRPSSKADKKKKGILKIVIALYEGRELTLHALKSNILPIQSTQRKELPAWLHN